MASSAIAYTGVFTAEYRDRLLCDWVARCAALGVPVDTTFSLERVLSRGPDQVCVYVFMWVCVYIYVYGCVCVCVCG